MQSTIGITFAAINLFTFFLYGYDKWMAKNNLWRIPEKTLHFFAMIGGTPGAFIAQKIFHHKTKKKSFQIVFWSITIIQISLFILFLNHQF